MHSSTPPPPPQPQPLLQQQQHQHQHHHHQQQQLDDTGGCRATDLFGVAAPGGRAGRQVGN
jgi:hypothetical protein